MSSVEATHRWPVAAFPVRVILRGSGLDLFEHLVLELAAAGETDPERSAALTGLEPDFLRTIAEELRQRGSLSERGVTAIGRRQLEDQEEVFVDGWMCRDGLTGRPMPLFSRKRPRADPGLRPLAELEPDRRAPTEEAAQVEFVEAFEEWQRSARRDRSIEANQSETQSAPVGVAFLGEGQASGVPVTLRVNGDGRPELRAPGLPEELLMDRVEHFRPSAWVDIEATAEREARQLERLRAEESTRLAAEQLRDSIFGVGIPPMLEPVLSALALAKVLAEHHPSQHEAALTNYRKFTEAVAKQLGPWKRSVEVEALAAGLPKKGRQAETTLRPRFEALATPHALILPEGVSGLIGQLRRLKTRPDKSGRTLVAWPFWTAIGDPTAPESQALRLACARCPSLWMELELLRREGNPGAHHTMGGLDAPDYEPLDDAVCQVLGALGAAPVVTAAAATPAGFPEKARLALAEADDLGGRDASCRSPAVDALWRVAAVWANTAAVDDETLRAWATELPRDAGLRRELVLRRIDGLQPPDDDFIGYRPPAWVEGAISVALDELRRPVRVRPMVATLRPLLAVAAEDPTAKNWCEAVALRGPWASLQPLADLQATLLARTSLARSRWRSLFSTARAAVVSLFDFEEPIDGQG